MGPRLARRGPMSQGHEKLVAWQRADDLFVAVHRLAATFPIDERYGLASQMRRAAYSVLTVLTVQSVPSYPTFVLKYSIVLTRPSSRFTLGSQFRSVRARVMSGRRCLGSSVGSGLVTSLLVEPVIVMIVSAISLRSEEHTSELQSQ